MSDVGGVGAEPPTAPLPVPQTAWADPFPADWPPSSKRRSPLDIALRLVVVGGVAALVTTFAMGYGRPPARVFLEIPAVEPGGAASAMLLADAEEYVSTYTPHRDDNGSYLESGQELVRAFGAELVWADNSQPDPTTTCSRSSMEPSVVLAWFCSGEPYLIRLNSNSSSMPDMLYEPEFIEYVKHEIAHLVIDRRWCSPLPIPDGAEDEGIANSYATLFLRADRDVLADLTSAFPDYTMTPDTDWAATLIHSDTCA